jgi:hypothetical protein
MISRVPLRDEVYHRILSQVQRGDLPAGSRVKDVALAGQHRISNSAAGREIPALDLGEDAVIDLVTKRDA